MPDEKLITLEPYALLYTRAGAGVCLRDPLTGKAGVIFMELADGMALERSLNGERPVRPDTSSLLSHFLSAMECRVRLVLMENILPQLEQLDADSPDRRAPVYVGEP